MIRVVTVKLAGAGGEPDVAILESDLTSYSYDSINLTVECASMEEAYRTVIAYNDAREVDAQHVPCITGVYNSLGEALTKARKGMKLPTPIFSTPPTEDPLKVYMLRQSEVTGENAYKSCIVLARTEGEARNIHPLGPEGWTHRIPSWVAPSKKYLVDVMELGLCTIKDMGPGTVLNTTEVGNDCRHLAREVRYYEYWKKEQEVAA